MFGESLICGATPAVVLVPTNGIELVLAAAFCLSVLIGATTVAVCLPPQRLRQCAWARALGRGSKQA